MKKGLKAPKLRAMKQYEVNRRGQPEAFWQPMYDFQEYIAAGPTILTFFQTPNGQGGKTLRDTNMEAAGMLPAPKTMLVVSIEVVFLPIKLPSTVGDDAAMLATNWNDCYRVGGMSSSGQGTPTGGYLDFFIGSKSYLKDGPLMKFSNSFRLAGALDTTLVTIGQAAQSGDTITTDYCTFAGPTYEITPVKLESNQNFNVTLNFPAITSITADSTIGVILNGFQYRLSQ